MKFLSLTFVATINLILVASTMMYSTDAWHLPLRLTDQQHVERNRRMDSQVIKRENFRPVEEFILEEHGWYPDRVHAGGHKRARQMVLW